MKAAPVQSESFWRGMKVTEPWVDDDMWLKTTIHGWRIWILLVGDYWGDSDLDVHLWDSEGNHFGTMIGTIDHVQEVMGLMRKNNIGDEHGNSFWSTSYIILREMRLDWIYNCFKDYIENERITRYLEPFEADSGDED